ncbi:MAG: NADP-dependent oxidoreductase [Anaerolineales bacterium]
MNVVRLHIPNGPAGLVYEQIEIPQPKAGEVLVRVHAAAITRDELDWPVNRLPATPSYEVSGVVAALGKNVEGFTLGDEVFALTAFDRDGAAAEFVIVPQGLLAHKPKTLDHIQSAAIPMTALTAWQGLFEHGHLEKGQRVLIHGATGGVGHVAVQLARWCGAHVIGTVSSENVEIARNIGVTEIVDTSTTRFESTIHNVDLVFDTAGGERLEHSPAVIRKGGRLVSVATEPPKEYANSLGVEALYFVVSPNREQLNEIAHLVDDGCLHPIIAEVFPLSRAREAFEKCQTHRGVGKIVLQVVEE